MCCSGMGRGRGVAVRTALAESRGQPMTAVARRRSIGAEVVGSGVHFRVWAPRCRSVAVVIEADMPHSELELDPEAEGYFSGLVPDAGSGTLYRFRLDQNPDAFPDPASRFQPDGPHGP